jgi:peptidoglycan-associated lipoprotein
VVEIDPKILELCDIPTPRFDFDSAALHEDTKASLDALAACFVGGNAKDKNMRLVGHADPRGTEEYNMGLGQRRAASVAGYLEGAQLAQERMETSSRGELDAVGSDEASWAKDRKVQIFLAE